MVAKILIVVEMLLIRACATSRPDIFDGVVKTKPLCKMRDLRKERWLQDVLNWEYRLALADLPRSVRV